MVPVSGQWRCRICNFDRYHQMIVLRKNGSRYETSFYACSQCSVMFLSPGQFDANSTPHLTSKHHRPWLRRCGAGGED
jgi:hypothetical protein